MKSYLEFESDIKSLEEQLDRLKDPFNNEGLEEVDTEKINQIQNELVHGLTVPNDTTMHRHQGQNYR